MRTVLTSCTRSATTTPSYLCYTEHYTPAKSKMTNPVLRQCWLLAPDQLQLHCVLYVNQCTTLQLKVRWQHQYEDCANLLILVDHDLTIYSELNRARYPNKKKDDKTSFRTVLTSCTWSVRTKQSSTLQRKVAQVQMAWRNYQNNAIIKYFFRGIHVNRRDIVF